jgi:hypothetical protein
MVDSMFILAILALGWGLSLATYRPIAHRHGWPTGYVHEHMPPLPVVIGLFAVLAACAHAADRGLTSGGLIILVSGVLLAAFWTGFVRVGSQVSLLLAPLAAVLLLLRWMGLGWG